VYETDLHLDPNEASDLCPVTDPGLLERRGWDRAFLTVLDEEPIEHGIAVLGHAAGHPPAEGWEAEKVSAEPTQGRGKTEDAESCARRGDHLYVLGSQFGSKDGPLDPSRSWLGRMLERDIEPALRGEPARVELVRLRFGLHRAVNDALASAQVELIELGPATRAAYIDATIARGAEKQKRWAGRVRSGDHPINVEGADFRPDGRLVLGLRYPVTAEGHPLLVELHDVDSLFAQEEPLPSCGAVWVLDDVGSPDRPMGVRALHGEGDDRFDAVLGDLDAANKGATVLEDHPEGGRAESMHVRFELPLTAGGGPLRTEHRHTFEGIRRVEGIALGDGGHAHYVIDEEGHVALRTLVLD
jgi:hypothetical protein